MQAKHVLPENAQLFAHIKKRANGDYMKKNKAFLAKLGAGAAALAVWQMAAMLLDSKILLASPLDVAARLTTIWQDDGFFGTVLFSFWHIVCGFLAALVAGSVLAAAAYRLKAAEYLLMPYMVTIKSVPVASFIVIALVWLSSKDLSIFISFLMGLPIIYTNLLQGLKSADVKMLEMADIFRVSWLKRAKYILLPQIKPFLLSACSIAMGLAWKAGIAAEIIGIPQGSIGEGLYNAKVYLETTDLFAWTVIIVALSVGFEKLFLLLLKSLFRLSERR